jgi:hypothetical protein
VPLRTEVGREERAFSITLDFERPERRARIVPVIALLLLFKLLRLRLFAMINKPCLSGEAAELHQALRAMMVIALSFLDYRENARPCRNTIALASQ